MQLFRLHCSIVPSDTLKTHVAGVLTRHPEWEHTLAGFQAEGAWMVGDWDEVQKLVERTNDQSSSMVLARVLLAMREGNQDTISDALSRARMTLGGPIVAGGIGVYRRSYDAVLELHLTHELELIYQTTCTAISGSQNNEKWRLRAISDLSRVLSNRLDLTLPTFRSREPVLSMRRTAFSL